MSVEALRGGKRIIGTMIRLVRNPAIARVARNAGLDFIMFDMEHGPYSFESLTDAYTVCRSVGLEGFVRVPELSRGYVSRALDAGATGVMVPMLETAEQARELVAWAKYPPVGKRGFGSFGGNTGFGPAGEVEAFMEASNRNTLTIAQIESAPAIDAIDEIAAVVGIDALLIGPNDLAISLGRAGDLGHSEVLDAIRKVAVAAKEHNKILGMHGPDDLIEQLIPQGLTLAMSAMDAGMLLAGMKSIAERWAEK